MQHKIYAELSQPQTLNVAFFCTIQTHLSAFISVPETQVVFSSTAVHDIVDILCLTSAININTSRAITAAAARLCYVFHSCKAAASFSNPSL